MARPGGLEGPVWANPVMGMRFWPGRAARGRRLGRPAQNRGGREKREGERESRERNRLTESKFNFSQNFQLTLEKF